VGSIVTSRERRKSTLTLAVSCPKYGGHFKDAYDRDFKITIIKDCCRAFDAETHEFTIKDLKATREEIEMVNVNEFIVQRGSATVYKNV